MRRLFRGEQAPLPCEKCGRPTRLAHLHLVQVEWRLRVPVRQKEQRSNLLLCEQCYRSVVDGARPFRAPVGT